MNTFHSYNIIVQEEQKIWVEPDRIEPGSLKNFGYNI